MALPAEGERRRLDVIIVFNIGLDDIWNAWKWNVEQLLDWALLDGKKSDEMALDDIELTFCAEMCPNYSVL